MWTRFRIYPIATQLTYMPNITWIEFSTTLLTFESRIEQLNAVQNLSININTAKHGAITEECQQQ